MRSLASPSTEITDNGPDRPARLAGKFLLLTAGVTAVMVFTRVAADADQDTLLESLRAVDENRELFGVSGAARLLSGIALIAAAWFLLKTWIIRDRWASPVVPYLFALSGVCTVLSGAFGIVITAYPAPETTVVNGVANGAVSEPVEICWALRWITGKIAFAIAGLAVIVAARYQWQVGGTLRWIAPTSLIIGVAMQFIWMDAATIIHPIVGTAFFLWLIAVGTMLSTGRVERHFVDKYGIASRRQSAQQP